VKEYKFLQRIP